jgi:hypothetical protein
MTWTLKQKVRQFQPHKFRQNLNAISLRKILTAYIKSVNDKWFADYHQRNNAEINLDNVVLPQIQDEEPAKFEHDPASGIYTITMTPTSVLTDDILNQIANGLNTHDITITGYGHLSRKWQFNRINEKFNDVADFVRDFNTYLGHQIRNMYNNADL